MPIHASKFTARIKTPGEQRGQEREPSHSTYTPGHVSGDILEAGLGEFRGLAQGIFSPDASGIVAATAALREFNQCIEETNQRIAEALKTHRDGASRPRIPGAGESPISRASLTPPQAADPVDGDPQLRDEDRAQPINATQPISRGKDGAVGEMRSIAESASLGEAGDTSDRGAAGRISDDFERRITEARRNVAVRAAGLQDGLPALLEQAVSVMETLIDQLPTARVEDLKRRVELLEQRVNNDRSNARS